MGKPMAEKKGLAVLPAAVFLLVGAVLGASAMTLHVKFDTSRCPEIVRYELPFAVTMAIDMAGVAKESPVWRAVGDYDRMRKQARSCLDPKYNWSTDRRSSFRS
jgi:hypothetical protein